MRRGYKNLFQNDKAIIGMIHLAGPRGSRVSRAIDELKIYEECGVDGAIIEDYHGGKEDVIATLERSQNLGLNLTIGVNVLSDRFSAFELADQYGARFVQFDTVHTKDLDLDRYQETRVKYPNISMLGGVAFKYIPPTGNPLEKDLAECKPRCEAIVTTGEGTGQETPIDKLTDFKRLLKDYPLIVGAGVTADNVREQMQICDAAIVGSYFKVDEDTYNLVDPKKVRSLVDIVRSL